MSKSSNENVPEMAALKALLINSISTMKYFIFVMLNISLLMLKFYSEIEKRKKNLNKYKFHIFARKLCRIV